MKIVFLGDSLTAGTYGGSYFNALRDLLPQHTLINAGIGGNTVLNLLERADRDVIDHAPDAVFVMVGGNDSISYAQAGTRSYYRNAQRVPDGVVTPEQFAQAYRELITTLQLAHIEVWIGLPPSEYSPVVAAAMREYNLLAKSIARGFNAPVLDLDAQFTPASIPERPPLGIDFILTIGAREKRGWNAYDQAQRDGGFVYTFDGLHLTPASAQSLAQRIAAFIQQHAT
jgi:lysophospholipase L1-like esterase